MLSKHIFDIFMKRDTLLHPDTVEYIKTRTDPMNYVNNIVNNIQNFPLVLTMNDLKDLENSSYYQSANTEIKNLVSPQPSEEEDAEVNLIEPVPISSRTVSKAEVTNLPFIDGLPGGRMKSGAGAGSAVEDSSGIKDQVGFFDSSVSSGRLTKPALNNDKPDIKIISDITGKSTCEGIISDFTRNINYRFNTLKSILRRENRILGMSVPIEKINVNTKREVRFIGMITDISTTKKGNIIISVEDDTSEVRVFLKSELFQYSTKLLKDEVIGIIGETNPEFKMVMTERFFRPTPPKNRNMNRADENVEVVFISDIHVGSNMFLEKQWKRFVTWLNGDLVSQNKNSSADVRYLVVAGDLVDGIGIYPDQEEELVIKDIHEQYSRLGELLSDVSRDIKIILSPGNHDAVRQAEPQPALLPEFQKYFDPDIVFVGNPCFMALNGVEILVYHGRSFDDIVKFVPEATYTNPILPMKEMLLRRHLVPIYGERTPIAPEHRDNLLIDRLPDIFVTGHVHTSGCERYSDMLLINASAWQAQTSFQRTLNFNPDPCKAYKVNLNTLRPTELDFSNQNF